MASTQTQTRTHEDFVAFMVDYTAFLGRMRADESDKLQALASKELSRIEHSITVAQANAKQLENYERRRESIQTEAGYEGMTFRQVIMHAPKEEQDRLWQLFTRFESNVAEIRFYNDKSMTVARDNMMEKDPASVIPGLAGKGSNPYERIREQQQGGSNMLETKA